MLDYNEPTVHLPALFLESKNADWGAGKTSGYAGRDKNAEPCFVLSGAAGSRLEIVAFNNKLNISLCRNRREIDIQQWMVPPLQELLIDPGLGRAATKTAMEAAAKRASLDNMVKMSGRLGLQAVNKETKTKLGIRLGNLQ
jgi:hypothetical protein